MPSERPSVRGVSGVGRYAGAAPPTRVQVSINPNDGSKKGEVEEGGCRSWFRKMCPCCCEPQASNSYDVTDKVEVVPFTPVADKDPPKFIPLTNGNEMEEVKLCVRAVDLLSSQSGQNRTEHHTDAFHGDELVLRRGQAFQIQLELSRPYNQDTDSMHLDLKTGPLPIVSKGTHIIVPLVDDLEDDRWEAKIVEQIGNTVKLSVNSTPKAVVGVYALSVTTCSAKGGDVTVHEAGKKVVMLFNPWCEDDSVFLDDDDERNEYVLNDTGRIYYGTEKQIGARTWNFGQFQEGILEACLFLLEKSEIAPAGRWDPINVVRVISAMINAQDDYGVLIGNWSGDYSDGTSPAAWSSSVDILKQYHEADGTPVAYGQCWVFSGVTNTVLRCLGIPARSVTNFQSAHDTDVSLTTDVYLDEEMEPINHLNKDSVWNFHVWNDCWMARPDLPPGHGGWQAVDSTPQETSQGTFRCGPASVNAIRAGQVFLKYDTPFVFAEVNSDKIYWQRNLDGTFAQIYSEKKAVGHFISTKAVGSDERADITKLYKHSEDSEEERISVETASRYGSKPDTYSVALAEDVKVEVTMDGEGPHMGADAHLSITVTNLSSSPRSTALHSQASVMYYTGVLKGTVKKETLTIKLLADEEKTIDWVLPYQLYQDQLVDQAAMMLTLSGRVSETQQVLAHQTTFRLRTPDLEVKPVGDAQVGKEMSAKISFTNPLPRTLQGVVIRVEGLGLQKGHKVVVGDVGANSTVRVTEHFVPTQPGLKKLVVSLDCKQMSQVHGVADILVLEA
ncbi:protein-glutamine gamma-glutamyltransferase K [Gadus macrocephalus]|uniref:protein-glutamine gamma-glutamyltransferase K n=1 Tax=Gadus macrocephalus TaxID=80720 RepID=UPI0028CB79DE|nr:protein-glutamine gamma-glutamyltransferase K [Gadus macrocephalus]